MGIVVAPSTVCIIIERFFFSNDLLFLSDKNWQFRRFSLSPFSNIYDWFYSVDPPTDEELKRNLAIMEMKKNNAAELDAKYSTGKEPDPALQVTTGLGDFPKYEEYEVVVGKGPKKKAKKPHILDRLE